ncbi:hypothetical protein [Kamptonema formosum]|uniref:hypothetical protein n=1 Tax=Kamptonema formosum TaxID=331992 RepID=UPI000347ECDE|nr:hypothetical protein [Oscillatoria sp. PCC 10802]
MSESRDIFIDSQTGLANQAKEIESLLDIQFQLISDRYETWYEYRNSRISLTLGEHDFENDRDMNFEEYRYHLSVRALNLDTEAERKKWRDDFASFVFQKLKATQKYRLMLVEDLQVKLEEFCPVYELR